MPAVKTGMTPPPMPGMPAPMQPMGGMPPAPGMPSAPPAESFCAYAADAVGWGSAATDAA